jgi:hypothetical protein
MTFAGHRDIVHTVVVVGTEQSLNNASSPLALPCPATSRATRVVAVHTLPMAVRRSGD